MAYLELFPEEVIALQQELKKHPDILAKIASSDMTESLAIIAAELNILLDGVYQPLDLMRMLLRKLKERGALIVTPDPSMIEVRVKESKDEVIIEKQNLPKT